MTKKPFKMLVILATFGLAGLGIYGNYSIKREFDPTKFLPQDIIIKISNPPFFSAKKNKTSTLVGEKHVRVDLSSPTMSNQQC